MYGFGGRYRYMAAAAALLVLSLSMIQSDAVIEVRILNRLEDGSVFIIHCASKDDDLGERTVEYGGDFGWEFTPNIWGSTLFYCDIWWGSYQYHFDAYDYARDRLTFMRNYWWLVDTTALYFWNRTQYEVFHFWAEEG